jgi:hypothetical protein
MTEKQQIEQATAEAFVDLYNAEHGTSYSVVEMGDAPDARCQDADGNPLNLEITLTEDELGDIQAALGRSNKRNLTNVLGTKAGSREGGGHSLADDVLPVLIDRVKTKMSKRYGSRTALIIRDTAGVSWDWNTVGREIRQTLAGVPDPFDKGIYIVSRAKDRLFRIK